MPRKFKKSKVSICVFCEGESEQAYTDFLKSKFCDVAVFKRPSSPGLEDTDERNRWLCTKCKTFSTVQEAIIFLESL